MTDKKSDFVVLRTVQGELVANVLKSHLESEGIPCLLQYESAGVIYGVAVDGLGQVKLLVPRDLAEEAWYLTECTDCGPTEE